MFLRHFVLRLSLSLLCASTLCPFPSEAQEEITPGDSTRPIPQLSFTREVAVEAVVDSSRIPLNRNLTLTIKASCSGDINQYEFQWPNPPDIDRFDIVGSSSANIVRDEGGQLVTVKEFRYILKPVGQGHGRIGPATLTYTDKNNQRDYSLSTRALSIEITEPVLQGSKALSPLLYLLSGLAIVLLAGGGFVYLRKMRGHREIETPPDEMKSPEEIALEELEKVPELRLAGETVEFYSSISSVLRRYIDRTFTLHTTELTTHDIINNLRMKEVDQETIIEIEKILNICDMVKFARHEPPPSDLDRILTMAQDFFTGRRQVASRSAEEDGKDELES